MASIPSAADNILETPTDVACNRNEDNLNEDSVSDAASSDGTVNSAAFSRTHTTDPYIGYTENGCPTFEKAEGDLSACIDLFFQVVPDSPQYRVEQMLDAAWAEDPDVTLKLILNFGNVRKIKGGKMDRKNFFVALAWLWGEKGRRRALLDIVLPRISEHGSLQ